MKMDRLPDGTPLFSVRWDVWRSDWKRASPSQRVVLDDGRPAVLSPSGDSYVTVDPQLWEIVRAKFRDALVTTARKRERLCEACHTPMHLTHEYEHAWTFTCERCKSAEIHGKTLVGGTLGAGEPEKR